METTDVLYSKDKEGLTKLGANMTIAMNIK